MFPINPINFPQESPASTDNTAVPFCQMGNAWLHQHRCPLHPVKQQQFACSRCPSGKLGTYPTTNLSLLLTSLPDSKICINNPPVDSFQFNEAFLVLRAPNWTQYPLVSMAGREQCCSHPTHCLLGPPELPSHQAAPAWSPAAGSDLTQLPALLQHSYWKSIKSPPNLARTFQDSSSSKNKYFWFILISFFFSRRSKIFKDLWKTRHIQNK